MRSILNVSARIKLLPAELCCLLHVRLLLRDPKFVVSALSLVGLNTINSSSLDRNTPGAERLL